MIGLRVLPRLLPSDEAPDGRFNCDTCMATVPENIRVGLHCGYVDRDAWRWPAELPARIGSVDYDCDYCPGYVARSPAVIEAASAYAAYEKGSFSDFFPDAASSLHEAVMVAASAFNSYEVERIKEASKKR